jgi:cytochrome c oxidase assembly protein subunit 15
MPRAMAKRAVGVWLLLMAAAVFIQVGLGGITRLTDSGLSITEWKPLLGVVPPLDEAAWADAFARYQQLPQYVQLKSHLTQEAFKGIYFWEWFHRLWGRLLGVFFAVPALVFWRRGALAGLGGRLLTLFVFGGLQGALGWFMVMSGLSELVYVSHLRLAAHYLLALSLLGALAYIGATLAWPARTVEAPALRRATWGLLAVLGVQLAWGAFMAGLKAALFAPTWPTINGAWVPDAFFTESWFNNPLAVHFIHRTLALVLLAALWGWWWRARAQLGLERHAVVALGSLQVLLGILTVLYSPVTGRLLQLGLAHQLVGTALFTALVLALVPLRVVKPG